MPPSWHPVPACTPRLRCRRAVFNCSSDGAAVIPKSSLEIKNHCTLEGVSWQKPAVIPKLTPSNQESMQPWGRGGLQAEPFPFAATKIRIGRGPRSRHGRCRRNHSSLQQQKLESDAEDRCRNDCCRRNYSPLHRFPSLALKSRIDARSRA